MSNSSKMYRKVAAVMLWSNWEISMNLACSSLKSLSAVSRRSSAPKSMAKLVDLISDAGTISTKERRTSSRMASVGAKGWEWNDCSTRRASSIVEMEGADSNGAGRGRAAVAASAVVGATCVAVAVKVFVFGG